MIDAYSIGLPLAQHLARDGSSRIIARFDSAIQLESDDGTLWAITTYPNAGAMRIVAPIVPGLGEDASVEVSDQQIFSDDFALKWESNALFDPSPRRRALKLSERRRAAQGIANALTQWSLPDACGFWDELSEMWNPLTNVIARACSELAEKSASDEATLAPHAVDCSAGVSMAAQGLPCQCGAPNDRDTLNALVSRLVGRGLGLTPTGDDFLQALLVTLHSGDEFDRAAFDVLAHTVALNLSRTTRTSQSFLREALRGWAFGALKNVLDAAPSVTQETIRPLLEIGATSGPAYAFGVLMGIAYRGCGEVGHSELISRSDLEIASPQKPPLATTRGVELCP